MRVVKAALNLIRHCPAAARRDAMIHQAADRLNISPQALGQDLRREQRKQRPAPRRVEGDAPKIVPPKVYPKEEISLLELLVHHYHDVQPLVRAYLRADQIKDPICRELVELLKEDFPEALTEGFQQFSEEEQRVISRVQVEESRTIDTESSAVELAQHYILLFWKRTFEQTLAALPKKLALSNEERFRESTRLRHHLHALTKGWEDALPLIEAELN